MTTLIADEETVTEIIQVPKTEKPKLTQLMELVGSVHKDKQNEFHHYKYASAKAVLDKVQSGLIELGLYSIPRFDIKLTYPNITERTQDGVTTKTTDNSLVTVSVDLGVYDGDKCIALTGAFGSGSDKGDKAVMKAQTAALKYAWMTLLNIPTGDDPEADTATDARVAPNVSQPESKGNTGAIGTYENAKVLEVRTPAGKGPHIIVTDKGQLNTFDKDVIAQASLAQASGLLARFVYKETKWGKDVVKEKANGERTDG